MSVDTKITVICHTYYLYDDYWLIDVQYRQSESDGESDKFYDGSDGVFSYRSRDKHTYTLYNVINANIITI